MARSASLWQCTGLAGRVEREEEGEGGGRKGKGKGKGLKESGRR